MLKNVASQKIAVFAYDITTGGAKTGDAANITVYVNKDWGGVNALTDTSASELSSTNAPGWYVFDLTQGETDAVALHFTGKSSTSNIQIAGQLIFTDPAGYTALTATVIADALLDRDMSTGTDSGSTTVRTPRQALRALRNKVSIAAGTATICKEDDSATSWTAAVTTDGSANPITEVNPAGP